MFRTVPLFLIFSMSLLVFGCITFQNDGTEKPLRILSYNIHHGAGADGLIDLERIARVIHAASPDVVSLQEVDCKTRRSKGVDQAKVLAELTGMNHVFGASMDYNGGQYGNAVLTTLDIVETTVVPLPGEPRSALCVHLKSADDDNSSDGFLFIATHLDTGMQPRRDSVPLLDAFLESNRKIPAILAGDLNAVPDSPTMRSLFESWRNTTRDPSFYTAPAKDPRHQIDYILYRPADGWQVIESEVLSESEASDHRPVLAVLAKCGDRDPLGVNLLPVPQRFETSGPSRIRPGQPLTHFAQPGSELPVMKEFFPGIVAVEHKSEALLITSIDTSLEVSAEGYRLEIDEDHIFIIGKDKAGLFYGFMTLLQLLEDAGDLDKSLPQCKIEDWPALPYRAIHLDMKHHREKEEYYYRIIDKLARYKVNAVIAEMEDKLVYKRQPVVASKDGLTIGQWQKLSQYAKERNIEISPLIQGLGHASFILKHGAYQSLRDNPESDWAFNPLDPKTYEVQFDLYLDAIEATPHGRYLHIGGDEVSTTGRGSGKSKLELQMIWLNKVCAFAEEQGRISIFWDDMPLKHAGVYGTLHNTKLDPREVDEIWKTNTPEFARFLDRFPKNCIYMRWNYSSPQAHGNIKAMQWFRDNGLQVMGATAGQTRWVLMPQNESNIDNIRTFALSSIESGLPGLLLTLWDDDSPHFELYNRGIIAFAEYTWSGERRAKAELKAAYRQREFAPACAVAELAFIDDLEGPVAFYKNALVLGNKRNYLKRHKDPMHELIIDLPKHDDKGAWSAAHADRLAKAKEMLKICDRVEKKLNRMKSTARRNHYTLAIYDQVTELARFSFEALLLLEAYDTAKTHEQESQLLQRINKLHDDFLVMRRQFEKVYGETRILTKPADYILDQDHHVHLANQAVSFDWQFLAEILFLKKLETFEGQRVY